MCGTARRGADALPGLRPHHVQKDRAGTWEVSGLTAVDECGVPSTAVRIGEGEEPKPMMHGHENRSPRACAGETAGWRRLRFTSGHNLPAEDFRAAGSDRPPQQAGSNQQAALHLDNLLMGMLGSLKLMRKHLPMSHGSFSFLKRSTRRGAACSDDARRIARFGATTRAAATIRRCSDVVRGMTEPLQRSVGPEVNIAGVRSSILSWYGAEQALPPRRWCRSRASPTRPSCSRSRRSRSCRRRRRTHLFLTPAAWWG